MNIIEKRKGQLGFISAIISAISVIVGVVGIILIVNATGTNLSVGKLVGGIILTLIGLVGLGFGIFFSIMTSALKATKGNVSEDNSIAKKTVNMNKCENCGAEIEAGKTICDKCEKNLMP